MPRILDKFIRRDSLKKKKKRHELSELTSDTRALRRQRKKEREASTEEAKRFLRETLKELKTLAKEVEVEFGEGCFMVSLERALLFFPEELKGFFTSSEYWGDSPLIFKIEVFDDSVIVKLVLPEEISENINWREMRINIAYHRKKHQGFYDFNNVDCRFEIFSKSKRGRFLETNMDAVTQTARNFIDENRYNKSKYEEIYYLLNKVVVLALLEISCFLEYGVVVDRKYMDCLK